MTYIYLCARSPGEKIEFIPADGRKNRWAHVSDLCGILETEKEIPYSEHEVPNSKIDEISDKYKGKYRAFD